MTSLRWKLPRKSGINKSEGHLSIFVAQLRNHIHRIIARIITVILYGRTIKMEIEIHRAWSKGVANPMKF